MANFYWASAINGGGTGALDGIDPTDTDGSATALVAGDVCFVVDASGKVSGAYEAKSSAGMSETYPDVIIPDTNPSNWYWEKVFLSRGYFNGAMSSLIYANTPGSF